MSVHIHFRNFLNEVSNDLEKILNSSYEDPVIMEPKRVTKTQLSKFMDMCLTKYMESVVESGKCR